MLIILSALMMICTILLHQGTYYSIAFIFLIHIYSHFRHLLKKIIIIDILMVIFFFYIQIPNTPLPERLSGTVIEVGNYHYILKSDIGKVRIICDEIEVEKGNKIDVRIEAKPLEAPTNFNAFDYQKYCYSQKIFYQANQIELTENNHHRSLLRKAERFIENFNDIQTVSYTKQLILGVKDETMKETLEMGKSLSILHLFALSGMHLTILKKCLEKIGINNSKIQLFFLGIYVFSLTPMISLLRAYLMLLFKYWLGDRYNDLEILAMISILFCLYNPFVIYSLSFIYSFTIYTFMIISNHTTAKKIYPYLSGIPILLYSQSSLNPFSYFFVWVFSSVFEILYPILLMNILCWGKLTWITHFILEQIEQVMVFVSSIPLEWIFKRLSIFFIFMYYAFLIFMIFNDQLKMKKIKPIVSLFLCLFILYFFNDLDPTGRVVMIDVGQGDCFLIQMPYNQGNYLIDTGGNKNVDLAKNRIIPYLKSLGIKHLDALIITHNDFDHCGAKESLIANFKVKRVINQKEDIGPLQNLDIQLQSLEENDKSLVYYLNFNGLGFLFTGDMSKEGERQIVEKYPDLKVDVLKVGHHGSVSSTSSYLLAHYKPDIALISVGKNNLYHHPNTMVIEQLQAYGVKVYRSDELGMVEIKQQFMQSVKIISCRKIG